MIIKGKHVSNKLSSIIKSVAGNLASAENFNSVKMDENPYAIELKKPVSSDSIRYIYQNTPYIFICSDILAMDCVSQEIKLSPNDPDDENLKNIVLKINENLNDYQDQLYMMAQDYNIGGMGVCEVEYHDGEHFSLKQMPALSCIVVQVKINNEKYFLLKQSINGENLYFKIIGENYPDDFYAYNGQELGECMILGGDFMYAFYKQVCYLPILPKIFTSIAITEKLKNSLSNGNIAKGILNIGYEASIVQEVEYDNEGNKINLPSKEEVISDELTDAADGIAVIFNEYSPDGKPAEFDFIKIENDNDESLEATQEKCEAAILSAYHIPYQRLGVMLPEAMNSNQSSNVFEIYTLNIKQEQRKYKEFISDLVSYLYGIKVDVDIQVPKFSETTRNKVDILNSIWERGGLTLKDYITSLANELDNVIDLNDYDFRVDAELWNYRNIPGLYDNLDPSHQEELDQIESVLNDLS